MSIRFALAFGLVTIAARGASAQESRGQVGPVPPASRPADSGQAGARATETQLYTLMSRASAAYNEKEYAESVRLYEQAIKAGATNPVAHYNAACCCALLGRIDEAFRWLEQAFDAGWRDVEHLKGDADFNALHADARWAAALKRCQEESETFARSLTQPALRDELLKRMREDQRIRTVDKPDFAEWRKIDADNTAFMKQVIEKHGWPGKTMVGTDGAQAAWLMVQHADAEPKFQERCLELIKAAFEKGETTGQQVAYLTDRVLCAAGKPQRYGTQFEEVNGEMRPKPIEDEANVDARRKEVGLGTLEEYAKQMRSLQKR